MQILAISVSSQTEVKFMPFILCFTGPWFLGELLEGHTSVVFVWGMFVYRSYLPLYLTYVYGAIQVLGS